MTGGIAIPEGAIKSVRIAEAYADIASIEETSLSRMELVPFVVPVVQLPQKPPPFTSGFSPGMVGGTSAAAVGFISHLGLFNNERRTNLIVKVHHVSITNVSGGGRIYNLRRLDVVAGFTFLAAVPLYINAGSGAGVDLGRVIRNNGAALGDLVGALRVPDQTTVVFPVEAVINRGALLIAGNATNEIVEASIFYNVSPVQHFQLPG